MSSQEAFPAPSRKTRSATSGGRAVSVTGTRSDATSAWSPAPSRWNAKRGVSGVGLGD